ncbi:MAG: hypothetical protein ABSH32_17390 [Bryobacteraceae bacterium]|jgi:hypothetical protein
MKRRLTIGLLFVLAPLAAQDDSGHRTWHRIWQASVAAVLAGNSADAATSWGKYETNGALRGSGLAFGGRALGLKCGITAGLLLPQFVLMRRHPQAVKATAAINLSAAAVLGLQAAHNTHFAAIQQR